MSSEVEGVNEMAQVKADMNRRRQFFIKKEFQGKFILLYAMIIICLAMLTAYCLYLSIQKTLEIGLYSSHLKVDRSGDLLLGILSRTNIFAILAIVILVMLLSLYVFKRLNTHFFRMECRIDAMSQGDFTSPTQSQSRFNEISRLISLIDETGNDYRKRYEDIRDALHSIEETLNAGGDSEKLKAGRSKIHALLQEVTLPARNAES